MNYREKIKADSEACTPEQRRQFMQHMREGKTLGWAAEQCGMSFDAALGTMNANIVRTEIATLRPQEEVQ